MEVQLEKIPQRLIKETLLSDALFSALLKSQHASDGHHHYDLKTYLRVGEDVSRLMPALFQSYRHQRMEQRKFSVN
ncbi:CLUMA_CG019877, isoform A [Clunio marinus]|uniref:CLUMA_CG019877, isoform A n=1 Tax=Clunio marinus TaxID=568069 RepID=A0A1J1J3P3_9DIPT|nr:CLUMA_CG019877, isoform A [Clunio marinus]